MMNNFKVMDWLRKIRDQQAADTAHMSIQERLIHEQTQAQPHVRHFFEVNPEVKKRASSRHPLVAEESRIYRT